MIIDGPPPADAPDVSVIVPHYQDLVRLDLCLKALQAQTFDRRRFEIVVADNNSPVGAAAVEACVAGRARVVFVSRKGAGPARNGGVAAAGGRILAFTDADCIPEPAWLAQGVACLADFDLVGGRMAVLVDDPRSMTPVEAFERIFAFKNEDYVNRLGFTVTANLFCTKAVFDHVGEFVGERVSEDAEWCYRARAAGYKIGYAKDSVVGHPARKDWRELLGKWRRINAESYGLALLAPGGRLRWLAKTLLLPLSAFAHTPKALSGAGVETFVQRVAALGVLFRLRFWRTGHGLQLLLRSPAEP